MRNWCNAELLPYPTFAIDFIVVTSDLRTLKTLPVDAILTKFVCSLAVLTEESGCAGALNKWVPIPAVVVPNPTIFVLIVTSFGSVFS